MIWVSSVLTGTFYSLLGWFTFASVYYFKKKFLLNSLIDNYNLDIYTCNIYTYIDNFVWKEKKYMYMFDIVTKEY